MPTLKQWIEELTDGELVEGVVIGEMGWGDYKSESVPNYVQQPRGRLLTWEQALPWISYSFEEGIGAPGCNAIIAWTKTWIISVLRFDGLTEPFRVPRNPLAVLPEMPGGHWLQDRPPSQALLPSLGAIIDRIDRDVSAAVSFSRELMTHETIADEKMLNHLTEVRADMIRVRHEHLLAEARAARKKVTEDDA